MPQRVNRLPTAARSAPILLCRLPLSVKRKDVQYSDQNVMQAALGKERAWGELRRQQRGPQQLPKGNGRRASAER